MRRFIVRICLFVCVSCIVFCCMAFGIEWLIEKNLQTGQFQLQEDWHVVHAPKNDFLFMGNSRTWRQVDTELLSKTMGIKAYSLSQDGREARLLFYKLKVYLARNQKPKHIFLEFDPTIVNDIMKNVFFDKHKFMGYLYHDRLHINHVVEKQIGYSWLDVYVPLKRYFSDTKGLNILCRHLKLLQDPEKRHYAYGSIPKAGAFRSHTTWHNPLPTFGKVNTQFVDSIVELCQTHQIKLTLIYPPQSFPSYQKVDAKLINGLTAYAKTKKLNYWNFNGNRYNQKGLFYNHMHLNKIGALKYTRQLMDSIYALKQ